AARLDARRSGRRRTSARRRRLAVHHGRARNRTRRDVRLGRLGHPGDAPMTAEGGPSMTYFVVTRDAGPGWTDGLGAFDQPGVDEHTAFMNALAGQGIVLCAGPLAGSEHQRIHVLLL